MSLYTFFRVSKPSAEKIEDGRVAETYKSLRNRTFWGATAAYSLFYLCRLSMGVVKKPLIDDGLFSAAELGIVASAFYFVYAIGKFINGFIADYCNVRRYMATGLVISSVINLLMGLLGFCEGYGAFPQYAVYLIFVLLWGINGWVLSMGSPSGSGILECISGFPIFFPAFCSLSSCKFHCHYTLSPGNESYPANDAVLNAINCAEVPFSKAYLAIALYAAMILFLFLIIITILSQLNLLNSRKL